ncbi:hypothetical protein HELRODRAFT_177918 [Helobdella robusta]|uniref:WSC domain-containing protein n=1 Tax=Helobdella robusta TaxID=6412 RepID=T1FCG8_HELRO|nr:hypothetical protein HELRODRAFT_177918 [Helobdella robusta]ESN97491.1 hypothetical protein HELRODRAFT_177918 [Helobdella robusta]
MSDNFEETSFLGCFEIFDSKYQNTINKFEDCVGLCLNYSGDKKGYLIAFRLGSECHCGVDPDVKVPSTECGHKCSNRYVCGGEHFYAVYSGFVSYSIKELLLYTPYIYGRRNSVVVNCPVLRGAMIGFKYKRFLFVINERMENKWCLCGDLLIPNEMLPVSECSSACLDGPGKMCGFKNIYSVYTVRYPQEFASTKHQYRFCLNEKLSESGYNCNRHRCFPGWRGEFCDGRDLLCMTVSRQFFIFEYYYYINIFRLALTHFFGGEGGDCTFASPLLR